MPKNPFLPNTAPRQTRTLVNGKALLAWLAKQPNGTTRASNKTIADFIGVALDEGRPQSRRLNEALEALRAAGLITVTYEAPHPRLSPVGRTISLTAGGGSLVRDAEPA
jgi:hypothetical protein